jgi:ketosteroid isomerase-like protein
MKHRLLLTFLSVAIVTYSYAQNSEADAVAAAVESLRKAMVDADKASLENLAADDLTYGHSSGTIEDKAAFVEAIASGKSDFKSIELSDQTIKLVGKDLALVRHKLVGEIASATGINKLNIGVLLVWQKQKGSWKLLARQAFKL